MNDIQKIKLAILMQAKEAPPEKSKRKSKGVKAPKKEEKEKMGKKDRRGSSPIGKKERKASRA
jgi:hypothetical protein